MIKSAAKEHQILFGRNANGLTLELNLSLRDPFSFLVFSKHGSL